MARVHDQNKDGGDGLILNLVLTTIGMEWTTTTFVYTYIGRTRKNTRALHRDPDATINFCYSCIKPGSPMTISTII
jgi:hypothetical protein